MITITITIEESDKGVSILVNGRGEGTENECTIGEVIMTALQESGGGVSTGLCSTTEEMKAKLAIIRDIMDSE